MTNGRGNPEGRGKTKMLRSLTVVVVLLLGLTLPTAAQKADSASEQVVRQSIEAILRQWEAGIAKQDPAAVAALFTEDGIFVTPVGVLRDHQQIKTYYEGAFKQGWNNEVVTLHEMHLAGNAAWAFGEYTLRPRAKRGAVAGKPLEHGLQARERCLEDSLSDRECRTAEPCAGGSCTAEMTLATTAFTTSGDARGHGWTCGRPHARFPGRPCGLRPALADAGERVEKGDRRIEVSGSRSIIGAPVRLAKGPDSIGSGRVRSYWFWGWTAIAPVGPMPVICRTTSPSFAHSKCDVLAGSAIKAPAGYAASLVSSHFSPIA
jgi:ketosteroid isomerase-like protein